MQCRGPDEFLAGTQGSVKKEKLNALRKAQARIAGALEAEQSVVPVMNTEDTLVVHVAHVRGTPGNGSAPNDGCAIAQHSNGGDNIC